MVSLRELTHKEDYLTGGHRLCAGCGASIAVRQVLLASDAPVIVGCATGCLEVSTTIYPYTSWKCGYIHNAFENVAATISGIEAAYRVLKRKGKIDKEIRFVAFGGDGGTYDIGIQAISGALERGHKMVYVCLPPETELILGDGSIITIGDYVQKTLKENEKFKEVINLPNSLVLEKSAVGDSGQHSLLDPYSFEETIESVPANGSVLSWNGKAFVPYRIVRAQRKTSPRELIKVTTASGSTLTLTPEHPVLIDEENGPQWRIAAKLRAGNEVYTPRKIQVQEKEFFLTDLLEDTIAVSLTLETNEKIKEKLVQKFGTLKEASKKIGFRYWQWKEKNRNINIADLRKICQACQLDLKEVSFDQFVVTGGSKFRVSTLRLNEDLMYLLGLIASDGYIRKKRYGLTLVNKNPEVMEKFEQIHTQTFTGRKVSKVKDKSGIFYLTVNNPVLYSLANKLDIKNDPKESIKLPKNLIAAFLRGFFDGDGHASILSHPQTQEARIILTTTNKLLSKRLNLMLKRLGIGGFKDSRSKREDIIISSASDIKRFIKLVGTNHSLKKEQFQKISTLLSRKQRGKYFSLAPKACGKILKTICSKHGIPIPDIDPHKHISSLAVGTRRATKEKIKIYQKRLEKLGIKEPLFEKLEEFLREDFFLDPIKEVRVVPSSSRYVYDITVEPTHLFIPEAAFIISNCYDNGAYMNTGIQRSSATPLGAWTTTTPVGKLQPGKVQSRKDLAAIIADHNIPYVAQASVSHWKDLNSKATKAFAAEGPAFLNVLSPCPRGWRHPSNQTIQIAKIAVQTRVWPLFEVENGEWRITVNVREPRPVEDWLKPQGRFKHLFAPGNEKLLQKIQEEVNRDWEKLQARCTRFPL